MRGVATSTTIVPSNWGNATAPVVTSVFHTWSPSLRHCTRYPWSPGRSSHASVTLRAAGSARPLVSHMGLEIALAPADLPRMSEVDIDLRPSNTLDWENVGRGHGLLILYPLAWLGFTLWYGSDAGWYPYDFLDPATGGGVRGVGVTVGAMILAFLLIAWVLIRLQRSDASRRAGEFAGTTSAWCTSASRPKPRR